MDMEIVEGAHYIYKGTNDEFPSDWICNKVRLDMVTITSKSNGETTRWYRRDFLSLFRKQTKKPKITYWK